ncbi:MAG: homogentisate 1,2-dioxygenase [Myxococcota bacterium]|jgi:homogentisate 1,2-dioxygenase
MLDRMAVGSIPAKHHIALRGEDGSLRWEECLTRKAFDGPYTIMYHLHRPHEHSHAPTTHGWPQPRRLQPTPLAKRHLKTLDLAVPPGPAIDARVPLLFNTDMTVLIARPTEDDPVYLVNADSDELFFIFRGGGTARTPLGDVRFEVDDYLCIPRGVPYRMILDADAGEQHWLCMEAHSEVRLLKQWRNEAGQLRMDAPYCHRDFRRPTFTGPRDDGIRQLVVKREGAFHGFTVPNSLLDVVGWDGTVYPWVFPMLNFQPRAGMVHLPPDWHGTFATGASLICSFVPRAVDFHPEAIPCPYPHHSADVDEFLFYVRGNFTSRRGVGPGSVSMHPRGIPHGPHPGAYEASIGHRETNEVAVMIDTFQALWLAEQAATVDDPDYMASFLT